MSEQLEKDPAPVFTPITTDEIPAPPLRTKTQILEEYRNIGMQAGDKEYRKKVLEAELELIYKKMYELNQEHATALEPVIPTLVPEPQAVS